MDPKTEAEPGDSHEQPEAGFKSLLDRARAGDSQAIGQLCQISRKYLLLIANQDLNSKMLQKFGASDVVQQSMLVANNKIEGFRGTTKGEFLAWMRQIVIQECRQASRGYQQTNKRNVNREQALTGRSTESTSFQLNDPSNTPGTNAVNDEQLRLVTATLQGMDEQDRKVIEMRNWQDLSFDEIGTVIGKSSEAARKIWSRAIAKLQQQLKELGVI